MLHPLIRVVLLHVVRREERVRNLHGLELQLKTLQLRVDRNRELATVAEWPPLGLASAPRGSLELRL